MDAIYERRCYGSYRIYRTYTLPATRHLEYLVRGKLAPWLLRFTVASRDLLFRITGTSPMGKRKRKLSFKRLPVQHQLQFSPEGEYFDLQAIFDKVNAEYFDGRLERYSITWGRKRKFPPKEYFVFGTIQEEDRIIRIHPLLDAPFVPAWFLEYVIYHEMLHAVVPEETDETGRRKIHTNEFYRREREFHCFLRAKRWEDDNLDRFLR
jgi:hypothetical protein